MTSEAAPEHPPILVTRPAEGVAVLSLNRPERLNAWGPDLSEPMLATLEELRTDAEVRAVVLTGEGRGFCAGANLKGRGAVTDSDKVAGDAGEADKSDLQQQPRWRQRDIGQVRHPVFEGLSHYPKPLIAAVNGYAIGIGCLIPTCCSFAVAADDAIFSLPQTRLNILPAYGGLLRLARFVGRGNALNMALTGRRVGADEALRTGLVAAVYPRASLIEEAVRVAQAVATAPEHAARLTSESLDFGYGSGLAAVERADLVRMLALRRTSEAARRRENPSFGRS